MHRNTARRAAAMLSVMLLAAAMLPVLSGCASTESPGAQTAVTEAPAPGNSAADSPEPAEVEPEYCLDGVCVLADEAGGERQNRSSLVIRSRTAWEGFSDAAAEELLQGYTAYRGRDLDFSTEAVVAVFAGERSSGGYYLELAEVDRGDDEIVLRVREHSPSEDEMVTQALTYPALVMVVKDAPGEIRVDY